MEKEFVGSMLRECFINRSRDLVVGINVEKVFVGSRWRKSWLLDVEIVLSVRCGERVCRFDVEKEFVGSMLRECFINRSRDLVVGSMWRKSSWVRGGERVVG